MVTGIDICNKARTLIGYPYVYGGNSPSSGGFDCSGLVQYVYSQFGINLPRTTYDQIKVGKKITDKASLKAGDLVFNFDSNGIPQHVMLYSGNGNVIEAQYEGTFIKEHSQWSWQGQAVRVLDDSSGTTPTQTTYYRVISGSFKYRANAEVQQNKLSQAGFTSFLIVDSTTGYYQVVVGSYTDRANAELQQKKLSTKGFTSFITIYKK